MLIYSLQGNSHLYKEKQEAAVDQAPALSLNSLSHGFSSFFLPLFLTEHLPCIMDYSGLCRECQVCQQREEAWILFKAECGHSHKKT